MKDSFLIDLSSNRPFFLCKPLFWNKFTITRFPPLCWLRPKIPSGFSISVSISPIQSSSKERNSCFACSQFFFYHFYFCISDQIFLKRAELIFVGWIQIFGSHGPFGSREVLTLKVKQTTLLILLKDFLLVEKQGCVIWKIHFWYVKDVFLLFEKYIIDICWLVEFKFLAVMARLAAGRFLL